jgi:hypothetical protein
VPRASQADSAPTAATAITATRAATADSAADAGRLGGVGADGYRRRLYAVYDATTDSVVRGVGAVSVEPGGGPGVHGIRFQPQRLELRVDRHPR